MQKTRYEVDPHNRLVVLETGRKTNLPHFRRILDGKFTVGTNNTLIYHVKAPVPQGASIPHQIKLKGKWSLTKNHDLRLTLDKWGRETFGNQLTIHGEIDGVKGDSLFFSVATRAKDGIESIYVIKLGGSWQADKRNQLTFLAKKEEGRSDILTLDGMWEINKNQEIAYQYEKTELLKRTKKVHTLTFRGYWDIRDKTRLSYVIDRNSESVFNFKGSLNSLGDGYIKYELGLGLSGRPRPAEKTITLFGGWRIKKDTGLVFEIECENRKISAITFGAEARLADKDTISFRLRNDMNENMGISLNLSRSVLGGDGELFLRALKSKKECAVFAGAGFRW